MTGKRMWVVVCGMVATVAFSIYMVGQLAAQDAASLTGDFSTAAFAEVRDAQGQAVLRGEFKRVEEEDDDIERKATLLPAGPDADAAGDAEVEFAKATPAEQELEFAISKVQPGATYRFLIDGREIGSAKADGDGKAEIEVTAKRPTAGNPQ
jgi:hypothetical protein